MVKFEITQVFLSDLKIWLKFDVTVQLAVRVVIQAFSEAPKGAWSKASKPKQPWLCLSLLVFHCEQPKPEKEQNNKCSRYKETLSQSHQDEPWQKDLVPISAMEQGDTEETRDIFTQRHKKYDQAKQINWDWDQGWGLARMCQCWLTDCYNTTHLLSSFIHSQRPHQSLQITNDPATEVLTRWNSWILTQLLEWHPHHWSLPCSMNS